MPPTSHTNTINVLVTGAGGQLGKCLQDAFANHTQLAGHFFDRASLDITNKKAVEQSFQKIQPDYCINAAAYTKVDQAESEQEQAFQINETGTKHLAELCLEHQTVLIYPSTDYVFDGLATKPYKEADPSGPINVYGASKLAGEQVIKEELPTYFIVRTSWLYSSYGHNFYNSMLARMTQGIDLTITTDQTGTPTHAADLAQFICNLILSRSRAYGIYHYSNHGEATWYDFAKAIYDFDPRFRAGSLAPIDHYSTFAARPKYSVLSKEKCESTFGTIVPHWKDRLEQQLNEPYE